MEINYRSLMMKVGISPVDKYLFKVNNRDTSSGFFIIDFKKLFVHWKICLRKLFLNYVFLASAKFLV